MIRRPPRSTRTDTLFLHDALPILVADIGAGVAYAVRHPGIGPLLALHLVASIMVRPILELLPGVAGHVFRGGADTLATLRSEEHTSELQSLMRISYAVLCLKKKK